MSTFPAREYHRYLLSTFVLVFCSYATMLVDAAAGGYFLGADAVSAVNLVMPVNELFYAGMLLLGLGSGVGAARETGSGNVTALRRSFTVAISTTAALMLLLALALLVFLDPAVNFLTAGSSLQDMTRSYLSLMIPWFVADGIVTVLKFYTIISGHPVLVMRCAVVQFAVNIACNIVFLGVLHWGIWALAVSSLISITVMLAQLLPNYFSAGCPFRLIRCPREEYIDTFRRNVRYGLGFLSADLCYILFAFAMNALILRLLGEKALFAWSVIMMVFLTASYAGTSGQETCIALCGRYDGLGREDMARRIHLRTCVWLFAFIVLMLAATFLFPNLLMPLFGASDPRQYAMLLPLIALAIPFILVNNLVNIYMLPLIRQGKVLAYTLIVAVLSLHLPLLVLLFHYLVPGNERWCFLAMLPVQAGIYFLTSRCSRDSS